MTLESIVYASRPRLTALAPAFDDAVASILATSRANNARDDITGALLASHAYFIQVLEGPGEQVAAAMARIARDERHEGIKAFAQEAADKRYFSRWAMLFGRLEDVDPALVQRTGADAPFDPFCLTRETLLAFLYSAAEWPVPTATTLRLDRFRTTDE